MKRIKQLKGFTLIELIVVVIIIGVLAAIAAVAYNQFVGNARETSVEASAKKAHDYIVATSTQADDTADQLALTNPGTPGAVWLDVDSIESADLSRGTTDPKKFLVVAGTRSACIFFAGVNPGENGEIVVNADALDDADACVDPTP